LFIPKIVALSGRSRIATLPRMHTRTSIAALAAVLLLATAPALADTSAADAAGAQRLARAAAAAEQKGDLAGAQDLYARAAALDAEPSIVLALAKARIRAGHLVDARDALASVVYAPQAGAAGRPSPAREEAGKLFADLGARIPHVRLLVDTGRQGPAPRVTIDGAALPPGAERLPIPVDPGHHVLVVNAPGMMPQSFAFESVEAAEQTVTARLAPPPPPVAVVTAVPAPQPPVALPAAPGAPVPPGAGLLQPSPPVQLGVGAPNDQVGAARRAKFSVGRFFLESLGSALVGSLAAYGTYKATCSQAPCLGATFEALGANIVVTPITVWGLGQATGGDGGLGWAFLGGLIAFSGYGAGTTDPTLPLVVGVVLMPFTSALLYEVSSNINAHKVLGPTGALVPTFAPLLGPSNVVTGGSAGLSGRF
jgi:hypothetical protein